MGRIVVSGNISIDGVMQDPIGDEDFKHGGWFGLISESDREAWAKVELEEAFGTEALLVGRRTDEWFAPRWNGRTDTWAKRLNSLPKYVVSSTGVEPQWINSTALHGDAVTSIAKLKETVDGDIVVYASGQLVHTLMEHDLVDELRLMMFPFVIGSGRQLFGETTDLKAMRLADSRTVGDNLVWLTYQRIA